MLQEKSQKRIPFGCVKLGIIILLIIIGFSVHIFFLSFIFLYFFIEKSIRGLKILGIGDILEISGAYKCFDYILGEVENKNKINSNSKLEYKQKVFTKEKKIYIENMNELFKNKKDRLRKKDRLEKREKIINYKKNKNTELKKITKSESNKNKINKTNTNKKIIKNKNNTNYGFNSGKSIWDDYESVIDIMKKNK